MRNFFKLAFLGAAITLLGAACPIQFAGSNGQDGGVWRTPDKGQHWQQKGGLLAIGGERTINSFNIVTLAADPSNPGTVYAGTSENGMVYTLDGGESWQQVSQIAGGKIVSIAVDPKNKCIVYAAAGNGIIKTTDCTRTWNAMYQDSRLKLAMTSVAVDHFNPAIVYASSSAGDVYKSTNAGTTWSGAFIAKNAGGIAKVVIDPFDSRIVYAATMTGGVWRSSDAGGNWVDVSKDLEQFDGAKEVYDFSADRSSSGTLVFVSRYSLFKSTDRGDHWTAIKILTPPNTTRIYSLALNPANGQEMYYATATIFYATTNGGTNWTTKKLPTSRAGTAVLVDIKNAGTVYLGAMKVK